jgi:ubiquinone/menaquinone biosynthesis C-methylase UbiE
MDKNTKIQKCWIWNKSVEEFVKERVKGYTLNVCSGKSTIGDVKIDLDPQDNSVIKGDMRALKFADNTFDTVIQDPPWKIGFYERMKPFFECVRVCKIGGQIIYNAYWIPSSKVVKQKELFVRTDTDWSNTSIISIFEKVADVPSIHSHTINSSVSEQMY